MRPYRKTSPYWTEAKQAAGAATAQARRDAAPIGPRDDNRPALTLRIGADDGPPLVHWRLTPIRGQVKRYRVTDTDTGAVEFGRGAHADAKAEYVGELEEIAEGLRALPGA